MKTEFSTECEECGSYNLSNIRCNNCWNKKIQSCLKELKDEFQGKTIRNWIEDLFKKHFGKLMEEK